MAVPREVVTLQLGHYASSVGAHWWGLQEAQFCFEPDAEKAEIIHHDVLFRAGRTLHGQETYTPRLIIMDLKGSLSSLKLEGGLYQDTKTNTSVAWKGDVTTHREEPDHGNLVLEGLNKPQDHTSLVKGCAAQALPSGAPLPRKGKDRASETAHSESPKPVWSDFLRTQLHPRSILTIHQYNHDGEANRLEAFGQGEKLLEDGTCLEELEDRLHFYVEECDYLQGFQVLCDLHNGFSGIGAKVTELLRDEYAGKGILTWGLTPALNTTNPQRNFYRLVNTVLGLVHLSNHSSLFCPLSLNRSLGLRPEPPVAFPYLQYNASLDYHTSAILATALDTVTLPYRLQTSAFSMTQLAESLNISGRKVATAVAAVPFPVLHDQPLPDALWGLQSSLPWRPLSSCGDQRGSHCFTQSVVLRGIGKEHQTSNLPPGTEPKSILHMCETGPEVLARYLHTISPRTYSTTHLLQGSCKLLAPYPQYFSPLLDKEGHLLEKPSPTPAAIKSLPVLASLQSSSVLCKTLSGYYRELHQVDVRRWASYFAAGVEADDFQEALHDLRTLSSCYHDGCSAEDSEDEAD